jgi:hypothetical protein
MTTVEIVACIAALPIGGMLGISHAKAQAYHRRRIDAAVRRIQQRSQWPQHDPSLWVWTEERKR